ncbi:hypothetical protein A1O1_04725 [Capronia coronata CBS 617.96]|uniref:Cyclin-like domain-containing protein n=1 Tax=Capronia coronata CBS 617.96 TaxID=1182541 RepID=W9Y5J3_9EURO|nr:uncharacterized protein A1O1_04725 [Capronia coronata CBS 617.96]EXJ87798.1 hypothetical protein A1O1_04725 [Capronia coronata CBS 617.96]
MPPKAPPPRPRAGQYRKPAYRGRIEGLGSPAPTSLRATTPTFMRASTPIMSRKAGAKTMKCSNPSCPSPHIVESEQGLICDTCGAVAQEESGLVSEQGFGETDSGRITALGVHVGESQTHQRTYAAGGALGNAGREPTINRDRSEAHARTIMLSYQSLLGVRLAEVEAGMQIFKLAWGNSFVQGRTIDSVAVVCLYLACRRKHEQIRNERRPMYSLMLIDFAEKLNIDVFALGKMYSDLIRRLYMQPDGSIQGDVSAELLAMGPEVLVNRFVDELEFDREHRDKIKMDAIRIVQRMKRDWMSTGRRPSGVCGAAVILAARMNNYRRTTREVVLTAKVTEITINKRLEEFQDTASSKLSITQFRDNQILDALTPADPPSYQRARNPNEKKKRGRPKKRPLPESETAAEIEGDGNSPEPAVTQEAGDNQRPAKRVRIDADGYKIPEVPTRQTPTDPPSAITPNSAQPQSTADKEAFVPSREPRPTTVTRTPRAPPPPASAAELAIESEIEHDVLEALRENPDLVPNQQQDQPSASLALPQPGSAEEDQLSDIIATIPSGKDKTPGPAVNTKDGNLGHVSLSPTLRPDEFDSDDDVSSCLLSEEETRIKERVWVSMNADWLRQDHVKRIKRELKEAEMRAQGLDPDKEALRQAQAKGKRKDGTKRPGRRGDVSYLNEPDGERNKPGEGVEGGAEGPADRERSAAESVRKMFKTRGVYSRRVNYDVLDSIYGLAGAESPSDGSRSRSQSVASMAPGLEHGDREASVASTVASNAEDAGVTVGIFRGNAAREGSRQRSRASTAVDRREKKRKEQRSVSQEKELGDAHTARSVSRSRSPSAVLPDGEATSRLEMQASGRESQQKAEPSPEQQQLPTPQPSQSQEIPSVTSSGAANVSVPAATLLRPTSHERDSSQLTGDGAGEEEVLGPIPGATGQDDDDEDLLRLVRLRGLEDGGEDYDDDDDDDDDEDEDEQEGDVDAAFEGRYGGHE